MTARTTYLPRTALAMLVAVTMCLAGPAAAQVFGGGIDIGIGARRPTDGAAYLSRVVLGLPLTVRTGGPPVVHPRGHLYNPQPRLGLYALARPEIGAGPNTDPRYARQSGDEGADVCRDVETGRAVSSSRCVGVYAGVSAEAGVAVRGLRFGAGYRAGASPQPFGSAALVIGSLFLRFEGGSRGRSLALGLGQL